jgi:hypothetical protein
MNYTNSPLEIANLVRDIARRITVIEYEVTKIRQFLDDVDEDDDEDDDD